MSVKVITLILVALAQWSLCAGEPKSFSCAGYRLEMQEVTTCVRDSLMSVSFPHVELEDDCTLLSDSCINFMPFSAALVTYEVKIENMDALGGLVSPEMLRGTVDACQTGSLAQTMGGALLNLVQFNIKCPVSEERRVCAKPVNLSDIPGFENAMKLLSVMGSISITVNVDHEMGLRSCIRYVGALRTV